jgi:class 3 adenylate cyclase/tetratricopeptide (TPR) repeat protein
VLCPSCGRENPDGFRFCGACGSSLAAPGVERRKLATILFCDVTGSTAIGERADPETVRELMFRYFHEMRAALERHGGTVEKFIGDAVMAVFGVPEAHEDDPLRACRAALEMQQRMDDLSPELERRFGVRLQARIGVNTGEVVAGEGRETFVTGDAVNVAARLEQAAAPGQVVIGEPTYRLVAEAVEVEPLAPVAAKGKAEPLPAFLLRDVAALAPPRPAAAPLIGRDHDLDELCAVFEQTLVERRCVLATVVGEPGVGKSRLVAAAEARLAGRARVLRGRCLSYGEGITLWPIAEIVREAAAVHDDDTADEARAKVARLVDGQVASRVAALAGLGGSLAPEEVAWAVRQLVVALAADQPLVLVVEDLHWAEPTLLDLLATLSGLDAPALLLLTARPELLDVRPDWPGIVRIGPLEASETERLLHELLGHQPDAQLVARTGGNPLFVHELVAFLRQDGDDALVPSSLSGLLAARLDRLPAEERDALERAAVEGEIFHRGAVAALLGSDVRVAAERLSGLVARELAFPAQAWFVDEAAFRFRHALVRDAAYGALVKRLRAELHERFADWLEDKLGDRLAEAEEIVGYHLEQAYRYGTELGPVDAHSRRLAERASGLLYDAGRRAHERGDVPAAVNLLQRSADLTADHAPERVERLLRLAAVLFFSGDFDRVEPVFSAAERLATELGDPRMEMLVRLDRAQYDPNRDPSALLAAAEAAITVFEAAGDDEGLAKAWAAVGDSHYSRGQLRQQEEAFARSLLHARRAGDAAQAAHAMARISATLRWGPYHVDDAVARIEQELSDDGFPPHARAVWTSFWGELEASRGDVERGRVLYRSARALAGEIGDSIAAFWVCSAAVEVELLAGDPGSAAALARENLDRCERMGHGWPDMWRATLARVLLEQGRIEETERALDAVERIDSDIEVAAVDLVRAPILARRGDLGEAERMSRRALDVAERTDSPSFQATALRMLGGVLARAGKNDAAAETFRRALELEEERGAALQAARTRELLAELSP